MAVATTQPAEAAPERFLGLEQIEPIPLAWGPNQVARFTEDGREGIVIRAWRDNGNAWGYQILMFLVQGHPGSEPWQVASIEPGGDPQPLRDLATVRPHADGALEAARLLRGRLDGRISVFLAVARRTLTPGASPAEASQAQVILYRLEQGGEPGLTADVFRPVRTFRTRNAYCDAEMLIDTVLGIPNQGDLCEWGR
ncbi:MAG: hypothetical protein K2X49_26190 [Acetobacteraceae bacterium]|nr:hypothetical protein [Acetobacteraceae bacterium]